MSAQETEEMARRAAAWIASPEGQQAFRSCEEQARELSERFREAQEFDWRELHRPMTI